MDRVTMDINPHHSQIRTENEMLDTESLVGKRVLVTGGGTGIGAATARLFGAAGAYVGVHYRQARESAEAVARFIREAGGQAHLIEGDLQDQSVRQTLVRDFVHIYGGVDVLVNNAGACYEYAHFTELEEGSWDLTMTLNAKAPFFLSRSAFLDMKPRGNGRIINISSVSQKYGGARSLHYCASKAALDALTVGFAREGAQYNILVNSIRCGLIDTGMHQIVDGYSPEQFKQRLEKVPLKRAGSPDDVARMALFLAGESGNFITGEVFAVAGGD